MEQASKLIYDFLKGLSGLTDVVGSRVYPILAKENVTFPFAVYTLGEVPYITKDAREFNIRVGVYFDGDQILSALKIADVLKTDVDASRKFDFQSSNVGADYETSVVFAEINFKLIL